MEQHRVAAFRRTVYAHFAKEGRALPWREKVTPYRAFVSEIMLQQTQAPRVAEFFPRFVKRFPNWKRLAEAELKDVLAAWQGMGYNRRARFLREAAKRVTAEFKGRLPDDPAVLVTLPGVGKATAASIAAFGFNKPAAFIETNIRAVFIHHFFRGRERVTDAELLPLVERTLDKKNPRRWYSALMDYGTALKRLHKNPARRSAHHQRQSKFEGSIRQARGALLKTLLAAGKGMTAAALARQTLLTEGRAAAILAVLAEEGLVKRRKDRFRL
ncbi:MAG: A/G-specific adenine glycosylase [Nitrospinae bacterium]|nr:A/G-specific adenine glycosylase [Nitrospinota bacterium]